MFQLCNMVLSTIVTMSYSRSSDLIYPIIKMCYPFTNLFLSPPPPSPSNLFVTSYFHEFNCCLFIPHVNDNHDSIFCLAYCTQHNAFRVHLCSCNDNFLLFKGCIIVQCVSVCECVCVQTPDFKILLSVDGHLDFFRILAIVNHAAMYIGIVHTININSTY